MGYQGKDLKEYGIKIEIVRGICEDFWVHQDTPPELLAQRDPGHLKCSPRGGLVEDF